MVSKSKPYFKKSTCWENLLATGHDQISEQKKQCRANKGTLEQPNLDLPRKKCVFFMIRRAFFPTKTVPKTLVGEVLNRLPGKLEDW